MTYDSTGSALHWAACSLPLSEICNRCSVKDQNRMSPQQFLPDDMSTGKRACVSESQSGGDKNSLAQALFASEVAVLGYFVALSCHSRMIVHYLYNRDARHWNKAMLDGNFVLMKWLLSFLLSLRIEDSSLDVWGVLDWFGLQEARSYLLITHLRGNAQMTSSQRREGVG